MAQFAGFDVVMATAGRESARRWRGPEFHYERPLVMSDALKCIFGVVVYHEGDSGRDSVLYGEVGGVELEIAWELQYRHRTCFRSEIFSSLLGRYLLSTYCKPSLSISCC
jgi:hypothetical protein